MPESSNQLRIIGGTWRGRKLRFANAPGLRPTLDRVRETVFNWLQFDIGGSCCLDCFAGSGALGFEALSRGAAHVDMLEINRRAAQTIVQNLQILQVNNAKLYPQDADRFLNNPATRENRSYNVVFLDPPFRKGMLAEYIKKLEQSGCMQQQCLVYIETEKELLLDFLSSDWQQLKHKQSGQTAFYLYQYC